MFNKLKFRLLYFNVLIISILLIVVFASLYLSTYNDVFTRIDNELELALNEPINLGMDTSHRRPNSFQQSITLVVSNDSIIDVFSDIPIDVDVAEDAFNQVESVEGRVIIDNEVWAYKVTDDESKVSFLNVNRDIELLNSLITRYILIFIASFITTGVVSYFMTNRSIKPVKESYEKQREFIANSSHELKTPLTVINTNLDVLMTENEFKDNKWIKYIKSETERMNNLTNDLLYLAKMEENVGTNKIMLDASNIIEGLLLGIEVLSYERGVSLTSSLNDKVQIMFDEQQFKQLVMILVDNAVKYTESTGEIKVKLTQSKLSVMNTGYIQEDELEMLFSRFYKADKSREKNNSFGLGLSIAISIAKNNNAKLKVANEDGFIRFDLVF